MLEMVVIFLQTFSYIELEPKLQACNSKAPKTRDIYIFKQEPDCVRRPKKRPINITFHSINPSTNTNYDFLGLHIAAYAGEQQKKAVPPAGHSSLTAWTQSPKSRPLPSWAEAGVPSLVDNEESEYCETEG